MGTVSLFTPLTLLTLLTLFSAGFAFGSPLARPASPAPAPAPVPAPAVPPPADLGLSGPELAERLRLQLPRVRLCYARAELRAATRGEAGALPSKLVVSFVVDPAGAVHDVADATPGGMGDAELERCVLEAFVGGPHPGAFGAASFPAKPVPTTVTYPLILCGA